MHESKFVAPGRRMLGLTAGLLLLVSALLAISIVAVGAQVENLPESRQELADLNARLPALRQDRDQLTQEIAQLKVGRDELNGEVAQLRSQRSALSADVESAERLKEQLPGLRADESKARAEAARLAGEIGSLTSERSALQAAVDRLKEQVSEHQSEIDDFLTRAQTSRTELGGIRRLIEEEQRTLAQAKDDVAAAKAELAQDESALANVSRLLGARREELTELTRTSEIVSTRLQALKGDEATARENIRQLADKLNSLYGN